MIRTRSLGFIGVAILAGSATTAICLGDAVGLVPARSTPFARRAISPTPPQPTGRLDQVLSSAKPWLTPVSGRPPSLRGKVILVNFWTYSCINSLRALPYLKAWQTQYGGKGLVVVGVHAPEFAFEHDPANVRLALRQLGVRYPTVQDNDFALWRDFGNEGWPGFYILDAEGRVRGYRVGEGNYADTEQLIRKLLAETGQDIETLPLAPIRPTGIEAQADWKDLASPESYLGYAKIAAFGSPGGIHRDRPARYAPAADLGLNSWDLAGTWTIGSEFATLGSTGSVRFHFRARDAHLVLGGSPDGKPVAFRITIDGEAPGDDHGVDVDAQGRGQVVEDRLYQLVRQTGPVRDRTIRITFDRPGIRAYVFTFG